MKTDIHPEYQAVVFRDLGSGDTFLTRSTVTSDKTIELDGVEYPVIDVEISSASHPFYTGKQRILDSAGRVEKFNQRFKNFGGIRSKPPPHDRGPRSGGAFSRRCPRRGVSADRPAAVERGRRVDAADLDEVVGQARRPAPAPSDLGGCAAPRRWAAATARNARRAPVRHGRRRRHRRMPRAPPRGARRSAPRRPRGVRLPRRQRSYALSTTSGSMTGAGRRSGRRRAAGPRT